ncbi:MAG: CRTAC1 family protein [Acidobacteria bacterium]|nr:CRTAC1 family protein [Acidobacteriota bacterium]
MRGSAFALVLAGAAVFAQGIASRGVRPQPRGKPSGIPFQAKFTDVAGHAGLRAPVVYGGIDRINYIVETSGGGVAFFDYDNDGWLDIFLVSGARFGQMPADATSRLYRNKGDGTFEDVTDKAGLRQSGWGMSVATGDIDNDGWEDLFVTYWGQNRLYRNTGKGGFEEITEQAGLVLPKRERPWWSSGATFIDYDLDGDLDLFIASYIDFDMARTPKPGQNPNCAWKGVPVACGPRGLPPGRLWMFENKGGLRFEDVSDRTGVSKIRGTYAMTAVAVDIDSDGWTDIYIAGDSSPSLLLRNTGKGAFVDEGLERGIALNDDGMEQAGMGIGIGDYNLDGHLDLFKTHFSDDTNILYRNDGKGNFRDDTISTGLAVETRFVGWGAAITDLDNDGLPDLFFVTGNVYAETEKPLPAYPYRTPRVVFRNLGNSKFEQLMEEAGPGVAAVHSSRGAAFGDFDNDGDIDVVIVNLNEPPSLLRNDLPAGAHWLKVRLEGVRTNRSAIGARVIVKYGNRRQAQALTSQASFYSVNDPRLHFGLGKETKADVTVIWPGGKQETYPGLEADRLVTIREGELLPPRRIGRAQ